MDSTSVVVVTSRSFSNNKELVKKLKQRYKNVLLNESGHTLNGAELISQSQNEQTALREELKAVLDEQTYGRLMAGDSELVNNAGNIQAKVPMKIFVG